MTRAVRTSQQTPRALAQRANLNPVRSPARTTSPRTTRDSHKLRLLFVLENYAPHVGGVETVFKRLCEGMVARGHDVRVLTRRLPNTPQEEFINGVAVTRVRCVDSRYLFTFRAATAAVRYAKDADVIHTTTFNAAPPAWLAARLRGKPVLITVHETWLGKWRAYTNFSAPRAWLHELLERAVFLPKFDAYACVSKSTAEQLVNAKPRITERVSTIYNGFDASEWLPTAKSRAAARTLRKRLGLENEFVVLGYGRPGTSKGFAYLIDAFARIKQRVKNARLVLVLSTASQYTNELARLKTLADNGGAGDAIMFLPSQSFSDLVLHVQMADCVVVPSLTEGFGYAVLESATAGVPVVASDCTSIPEVACGTSLLVPPKDPAAIADAVIKIQKATGLGAVNGTGRMRSAVRTTPLKKFPWESTLTSYERAYERLVLEK